MPEEPIDRGSRVIGVSKTGVPITEEMVEELAREAEAGYDLSKFKRVDRPSLRKTSPAGSRDQALCTCRTREV
jgi:hypothetical protein